MYKQTGCYYFYYIFTKMRGSPWNNLTDRYSQAAEEVHKLWDQQQLLAETSDDVNTKSRDRLLYSHAVIED